MFGPRLTAGLKQLVGDRGVNSLRDRTTNFGCNGFFSKYAGKTIIANGGPFYFTAGLKSTVTGEYPIDFSIRPYINAFLFHGF